MRAGVGGKWPKPTSELTNSQKKSKSQRRKSIGHNRIDREAAVVEITRINSATRRGGGINTSLYDETCREFKYHSGNNPFYNTKQKEK